MEIEHLITVKTVITKQIIDQTKQIRKLDNKLILILNIF